MKILRSHTGANGELRHDVELTAAEVKMLQDGALPHASSVQFKASDTQVDGDHYRSMGDTQPWDVLSKWLTPEEYRGYQKGVAIGYLAREQAKGGDSDIRKAAHHLQRLIEEFPQPETAAQMGQRVADMVRNEIRSHDGSWSINKDTGFAIGGTVKTPEPLTESEKVINVGVGHNPGTLKDLCVVNGYVGSTDTKPQPTYAHRIADPVVQQRLIDSLTEFYEFCYGIAHEAGWWVFDRHDVRTYDSAVLELWTGTKLGLITTEVAEAIEGHRKGRADDHLPRFPNWIVELGDAQIRCGDIGTGLASARMLAEATVAKMHYNTIREDHKPENRAKSGGKGY